MKSAKGLYSLLSFNPIADPAAACCDGNTIAFTEIQPSIRTDEAPIQTEQVVNFPKAEKCGCDTKTNFWGRLFKESSSATLMVIKFMALAFFLEALIILYIPEEWITSAIGQGNSWAIITAALLGIPAYTSNLSALPMIGGLLTQGMSPAAALAFLIAGPTTTLPAMAAVWSLVSRRIFVLYVSFALFGAVLLGYLKFIVG